MTSSSIVCEEVFDENSHPSVDEIREYASKIGIDPDSEPQLLPLATEGLMKALPSGWKPCYDDISKSYYYYHNQSGTTQWEHPLDEVYRGLVKKVRADSQSLSIGEPTEDATYAQSLTEDPKRPEMPEVPKKPDILPTLLGARRKLSPLKTSPNRSPQHESKLLKQKSEEHLVSKKITLNLFSSFDEKSDAPAPTVASSMAPTPLPFDRHPRGLERTELKLSGGGSMFLKSNTKKELGGGSPSKDPEGLRSILRERNSVDTLSKSVELDNKDSERDEDDKKSVRFILDNSTDVAFTFSDKSSSSEGADVDVEDLINVKMTPNQKSKGRFADTPSNLKLVKPNPADFIKPKLTVSRNSDSDEDSLAKGKELLEEKAEKRMAQLKQNMWEEKNDELIKFRDELQESQKGELERIMCSAKSDHELRIKQELDNLRMEMENRNVCAIREEQQRYEKKLDEEQNHLKISFERDQKKSCENFEAKKEELEKYYEEKLAEIEKELAERVERTRDELQFAHNSTVEQLRQNHSVIIEELKREFQLEEDCLRREHKSLVSELKNKPIECGKGDEMLYEKIRCEKRLLEDKYRCLKDKYLRLKTEVKMSIEKRNRKKEQSANNTNTTTTTTTTTGSETDFSNNKDRTPLNSPLRKPPTPKRDNRMKFEHKPKQVILQEIDTSASDRSEDRNMKTEDSSDNSTNPGRSRKKLFSRLKSSSTSRINNNNNNNTASGAGNGVKTRRGQRSCSPVENLRRQLQKLEDLEDQFPANQGDTYHLRYPFSDEKKPSECSSELEFFRHRIHLERDSIKRAKESLRSQRSLFQQRQKELKLKHGSMARHTLQQLCQEEKELTDMEVSLHRTRSLLGEKVIRLRHLEQSLQRASATGGQTGATGAVESAPSAPIAVAAAPLAPPWRRALGGGHGEDGTLSDLSSHSASSGISSSEFGDHHNNGRTLAAVGGGQGSMQVALQAEHLQESSEIIQSLENLNSEIKEIWDVLRTQQQAGGLAAVMPPLVYSDLGWPLLASINGPPPPAPTVTALPPAAPPSIPTLADRLHNYRQQVALANAQSTVVTHHAANQQGATTTLVERTRNLRHWLRQTGHQEHIGGANAMENGSGGTVQQATL